MVPRILLWIDHFRSSRYVHYPTASVSTKSKNDTLVRNVSGFFAADYVGGEVDTLWGVDPLSLPTSVFAAWTPSVAVFEIWAIAEYRINARWVAGGRFRFSRVVTIPPDEGDVKLTIKLPKPIGS